MVTVPRTRLLRRVERGGDRVVGALLPVVRPGRARSPCDTGSVPANPCDRCDGTDRRPTVAIGRVTASRLDVESACRAGESMRTGVMICRVRRQEQPRDAARQAIGESTSESPPLRRQWTAIRARVPAIGLASASRARVALMYAMPHNGPPAHSIPASHRATAVHARTEPAPRAFARAIQRRVRPGLLSRDDASDQRSRRSGSAPTSATAPTPTTRRT